MIWIVFHIGLESCAEPVFFGAFFSEAGAIACRGLLISAPNADPDEYHIVNVPVRTLS